MKFLGAVVLAVLATNASAGDRNPRPGRDVTVCLNPGSNSVTIYRGRAVATRVMRQAGIQLKWRNDERRCIESGDGFVVTVSVATPTKEHPGALAYALPFEHTHVTLFYDRLVRAVSPDIAPALLGYVLAHEIVHMLQGIQEHSASGVMKPHWDSHDYSSMLQARLLLSLDDIELIHRGMDQRASLLTPSRDRKQYAYVDSDGNESRTPPADRNALSPGR